MFVIKKWRLFIVSISYMEFWSTVIKTNAAFNTEKLIEAEGYPSETHTVITEDGYILTMHRIPRSATLGSLNKGVVFLQHGLLCSSADWVVMGQRKSFAFLLSDAGYDVWMGNARGNTFSRNHTTLDPDKDKEKFWAFSWHEIGYYDLPAMIDYVLRVTGENRLSYSGHSQGTTSFFVMTSERPEYNAKIKSMQALAPVAFMSHMTSPFVRVFAKFEEFTEFSAYMLGLNEFLPSTKFLSGLGKVMCHDEAITQDICSNVIFILCGFNSEQLNYTTLPAILQNTPAGASTRQILHYSQEVKSTKFRRYDFGWRQNNKIYGQNVPPDYPLHKITCPVALHYGDNDWMASVKDVDILSSKLPNLIGKFRVPHPKWNHLDFQWGIDADRLLYAKVISIMNRYA